MLTNKLLSYFFLACILLCIAGKGHCQADVTQLQGRNSTSAIRLSYYATASSLPDVKLAMQAKQKHGFLPVATTVFNGGIAGKYYWFHFTLLNKEASAGRFYIEIENPRLNNLTLYEVQDSNILKAPLHLGDFYPFSQRSIPDKNFVFPVDIPSGQQKEFYIYANQVGHTFTLPISVSDAGGFQASSYKDYLIDGIVYGILLFVSVLSFIFFVNTRRTRTSPDDTDNRLYLCYSCYILTGILWLFSYFGLGYQYLWGNYPVVSTISSPFFACVNLIFNIEIARCFLRRKIQNTSVNLVSQVCQYVLLAAALFPVFINLNNASYQLNRDYLTVFLLVALGSITVTLYTIVISVRGSSAARFYLVASIVKFTGIFNLALLEFGFTPALPYLERLLQAGILVETFLLSYAIAYRYATLKIGNYKYVLDMQEKERIAIARELHDGVSSPLTGILFAAYNIQRSPLPAKEDVQEMIAELQKLQKETRNISHQLVPSYIDEQPVEDVVQQYVENLKHQVAHPAGSQLQTISFSCNRARKDVDRLIKIHIYRIVQELLTNIIKHSEASRANIEFIFRKTHLIILAEDNGKGFAMEESKNGMGIKNILSRAEVLGGQVSFKKGADAGTLVTLKIPLHNKWIMAKRF